ncbi:psbP-like protein 1, chloroplastic [Zingiber officinale]|uniref:psbP-like protein 1, chloroplastic n=1 Tax=Zingiber officinale TaxID=94328 RepID=UPI001C4C9AE0|nr:psbP-like protein 1, chloroplastic [Zingiber officinale]XP_042382332.1 psbP-like protein 1, chloroplastic [Zingiber officinale]
MAAMHQLPAAGHRASPFNSSSSAASIPHQGAVLLPRRYSSRRLPLRVKAEAAPTSQQEASGRRQALILGTISIVGSQSANFPSFAAEAKKGFLAVLDKKDGYSFLYPFGWQEVVIQGQDKVFKDVIEPLENVSVNMVVTNKQSIKELGPPQVVAEALVKKVLAPASQKTKLIEAAERDVDGRAYYTFEFIAQAPNFTRHGLGAISIANGKFYTLTTGANERRWEAMKDKLREMVDSFKTFDV